MGNYIFRAPQIAYDTPLTFESLISYVEKGRGIYSRYMGSTVEINLLSSDDSLTIWLYTCPIAKIYRDGRVGISEYIDNYPSIATTWWIQKIMSDNGIPGLVGRKKNAYVQAGWTYRRSLA